MERRFEFGRVLEEVVDWRRDVSPDMFVVVFLIEVGSTVALVLADGIGDGC